MCALIGLNSVLYESTKHKTNKTQKFTPLSAEILDKFLNFSLGVIQFGGVFSL